MQINNNKIETVESLKFLVLSRFTRRAHVLEYINYIESKISKCPGLLFRAKSFLNKDPLLVLYYSYVQAYLNYANIDVQIRQTLQNLCLSKNMNLNCQ